jgi:hypothetical protein
VALGGGAKGKQFCQRCHLIILSYTACFVLFWTKSKFFYFKVTQYKQGKNAMKVQGKRSYDMKQRGFGGQTKPIFHKKVKRPFLEINAPNVESCFLVF